MKNQMKIISFLGCLAFSMLHAVTPDQDALIAAFNRGDKNAILAILSKPGFDINFPESQAMFAGMIEGRNQLAKEIAVIFMDHNFNVNFLTDQHSNTPLIVAAGQGDRDMVFYLLQHGAQINQQNDKGVTALMAAVEKGKSRQAMSGGYALDGLTGTVKLLIDTGANTQLKDKLGKTAYDYAWNKPAMLKLLEQSGSGTQKIKGFFN